MIYKSLGDIAELTAGVITQRVLDNSSAGEIVYDGPTSDVTQDVLDRIYNGASVPQAGE